MKREIRSSIIWCHQKNIYTYSVLQLNHLWSSASNSTYCSTAKLKDLYKKQGEEFLSILLLMIWWLCGSESQFTDDISCSVQTDVSQHHHHFGLSQPAPAAPFLNRAETYSHPCLLINTETSSKANSFWQRCQGPMLTSSPALNCAEFLRLLSLPYIATFPCFATKSVFSNNPVRSHWKKCMDVEEFATEKVYQDFGKTHL